MTSDMRHIFEELYTKDRTLDLADELASHWYKSAPLMKEWNSLAQLFTAPAAFSLHRIREQLKGLDEAYVIVKRLRISKSTHEYMRILYEAAQEDFNDGNWIGSAFHAACALKVEIFCSSRVPDLRGLAGEIHRELGRDTGAEGHFAMMKLEQSAGGESFLERWRAKAETRKHGKVAANNEWLDGARRWDWSDAITVSSGSTTATWSTSQSSHRFGMTLTSGEFEGLKVAELSRP